MKTCPACGAAKSLEEFHRNRSTRDGRATYCKPCAQEKSRESYARRQAGVGREVRSQSREVLPEGVRRCKDCGLVLPLEDFPLNRNRRGGRHPYCKPCHNARGKETVARLYGSNRHYHLVRRYGISAAEADRMLAQQGGQCAVCGENPAEHVDHCHETGEVRGLLCFNCNGGLGQFRDRVDILQKAIAYLERTWDPTWQSSAPADDSRPPTQRRGAAPSPTSSGTPPLSC